MLFQVFINIQSGLLSARLYTFPKVLVCILLSIGLSACSTTPSPHEAESNSSENIEKSTEEGSEGNTKGNTEALITSSSDAATSDSLQTNTESEHNTESESKPVRIPAKNLYLEQQQNQPISVSKKTEKDFQQALSFMAEKKWSKAEVLLNQIIIEQPLLSGSYVNKAIIAKEQGKLADAQVLLNKAIEVNNLNLYAHHLQGQIYRRQGEFDKAEQSYLAALAIWPDFSEAHASMAILLELYRGRLIDAHSYYQSYLVLKPDDEEMKRWQAGLEIKIKRAGLTIPVEAPPTKKANEPVTEKLPTEETMISDEGTAVKSDESVVELQETNND